MMAPTQLPGNLGTLDWSSWTRGLATAFIGGGAGAVSAGFGTMVVDPKDFNVYTGKMYLVMMVCFLLNGTMAMMQYLHTKPIPDVLTETTVKRIEVEQTGSKPAPPAQVITTIKETKITPGESPTDTPKEG